jgi:hypothetical protein
VQSRQSAAPDIERGRLSSQRSIRVIPPRKSCASLPASPATELPTRASSPSTTIRLPTPKASSHQIVAKPAYRLLDTSRDSAQPFLFATTQYQIPADKTLVSLTLPTQTGDPGSAGRIRVFAIADDGTPAAAPATTAPKDQTTTPGQVFSADIGSVTGGVTGSTGLPRPRPVG